MMVLFDAILRRCDMERFLKRHQSRIVGVLSGFDRVVFRGTLGSISYCDGFDGFLGYHGVLYRDFKPFVNGLSQTVKAHVQAVIDRAGRPYIYLESSKDSKEETAQKIAERDKITALMPLQETLHVAPPKDGVEQYHHPECGMERHFETSSFGCGRVAALGSLWFHDIPSWSFSSPCVGSSLS
jgi:hypothetical protein